MSQMTRKISSRSRVAIAAMKERHVLSDETSMTVFSFIQFLEMPLLTSILYVVPEAGKPTPWRTRFR